MTDSPIPWTAAGPDVDELWAGDGHSDPATETIPDMLATVFAQQEQLMLNVWETEINHGSAPVTFREFGKLDLRELQMKLHEIYGYASREFGEAVAHLDAKPWKKNPRPTDGDAFREEVVDTFHFFIEFCIVAGMTPEDLFMGFIRKAAVNLQRQKDSY